MRQQKWRFHPLLNHFCLLFTHNPMFPSFLNFFSLVSPHFSSFLLFHLSSNLKAQVRLLLTHTVSHLAHELGMRTQMNSVNIHFMNKPNQIGPKKNASHLLPTPPNPFIMSTIRRPLQHTEHKSPPNIWSIHVAHRHQELLRRGSSTGRVEQHQDTWHVSGSASPFITVDAGKMWCLMFNMRVYLCRNNVQSSELLWWHIPGTMPTSRSHASYCYANISGKTHQSS